MPSGAAFRLVPTPLKSNMHLEALSCGHCGAPLEVPAGTTYLTCAHCGSRLKVNRTASAVFTETLEQISSHTGAMVGQLETLRLQNELERIDREWQMEQEKYRVRGKDGSSSLPGRNSGVGAIIGGIVMALFALFWIGQAASMGAPPFMLFFGIVFLVVVVAGAVAGTTKASEYQQAEAAYRARRESIIQQLGRSPEGR